MEIRISAPYVIDNNFVINQKGVYNVASMISGDFSPKKEKSLYPPPQGDGYRDVSEAI